MKRFKSIDIFRGLSMVWMILSHLVGWWIKSEDIWLASLLKRIFDGIFGPGAFLFISGISTALSYRNRMNKAQLLENYDEKMVKNEYIFRVFLFFIIALVFNIFIAIGSNNIANIWIYYILFTISFCFFLGWPLLKVKRILRVVLGGVLWVINQLLLDFLRPFEGEMNFFGFSFHFLYNSLVLVPVIVFFTFFLLGTVIGDILYEISIIEVINLRHKTLILRLIIPSCIFGIFLIIFGALYQYPDFFKYMRISWLIYSLGFHLVIFSIMIFLEEFEVIKTQKSYRFLFYFSYYSLTLYLAHFLLYFLFLNQLSVLNIMFFVIGTITIIGFTLRFIYSKYEELFSIKAYIRKFSQNLTKRVQIH